MNSLARQIDCLAQAIYFEARGEPEDGQRAVADVVLNRVDAGFAPTVCAVVYQARQFSWTAHRHVIREAGAWERARDLAFRLLVGYDERGNRHMLHFFSGRKPLWAKTILVIKRIRNHVFLK